jgi:hypothetical protein
VLQLLFACGAQEKEKETSWEKDSLPVTGVFLLLLLLLVRFHSIFILNATHSHLGTIMSFIILPFCSPHNAKIKMCASFLAHSL